MRASTLSFGVFTALVAWGMGFAAASSAQSTGHDCVVAEARRLPDLGGVFLSDSGQVHVRIAGASAERREEVRASLSASCNDTAVVVETSRHTLAQLQEWTAAGIDVLSLDGVAFAGPDERADALVVGITTDAAEGEVRRLLAANGVPVDSVKIQRVSPIRPVDDSGPKADGGAKWAVLVLSIAAVCAAALGTIRLRRRHPRPEPAS